MKKFKMKTVTVTILCMERVRLMHQEDMEKFTRGIERTFRGMEGFDSVNDDLESLFGDFRLEKEPSIAKLTYFSPKLTEEELALVERKDLNYMKTFREGKDADLPEPEMKMSKSDSKFVMGFGQRLSIQFSTHKYSTLSPKYEKLLNVSADLNMTNQQIYYLYWKLFEYIS